MNETSKHTPLPWTKHNSNGGLFLRDSRGAAVVRLMTPLDFGPREAAGAVAQANADRILSCLAACRALPDPESDVALLLSVAPAALDMLDHESNETGEDGPTAHAERCYSLASKLRALLARIV